MIDRHHLLECILWPNGDGTFRKIVNTQKRLQELGIYDDYKLTIPIEHGAHVSMHMEFKKGTEHGQEGEKNPMYGKGYLVAGKKNPMHGKGYLVAGEKHPAWKGDDVEAAGAYRRALKLYKAGKITEEELQPYRDEWHKYWRARRSKIA